MIDVILRRMVGVLYAYIDPRIEYLLRRCGGFRPPRTPPQPAIRRLRLATLPWRRVQRRKRRSLIPTTQPPQADSVRPPSQRLKPSRSFNIRRPAVAPSAASNPRRGQIHRTDHVLPTPSPRRSLDLAGPRDDHATGKRSKDLDEELPMPKSNEQNSRPQGQGRACQEGTGHQGHQHPWSASGRHLGLQRP